MANGVVDPFGGFKEGVKTFLQERQFQQSRDIELAKLGLTKQQLTASAKKAEGESQLKFLQEKRAQGKELREIKKAEQDTEGFEKGKAGAVSQKVQALWSTGVQQNKVLARQLMDQNKDLLLKHNPGFSAVLEASDDDMDRLAEGNSLMEQAGTAPAGSPERTNLTKQAFAKFGQAGPAGKSQMAEIKKVTSKGELGKAVTSAAKDALANSKRLSDLSVTAARLKQARGLSDFALAVGLKPGANMDAVNVALEQFAKEADKLHDPALAASFRAIKEGATATDGFVWDPATKTLVPKGQ